MSAAPGSKTQAIDADALVLEIVREMSPSGLMEVGRDAALVADLGFDSLGLVELLVALEDALKLPPIDIERLGEIDRVSDLQRVLQGPHARISPVRTPE